ncbi:MAG TPA: hypothetical protein VL418_08100 [Devosiaceae bacterium]|jgi:hypothetical protein|nr:hypothetical protein [Devosiaceae bacterium]
MSRILQEHESIREWVEARGGAPMLEDLPNGTREQVLLQLTFDQHLLDADHNEGPDPIVGFELVGWEDWLAELDRQNLALKVNDERAGVLDKAFEFVARDGQGETTDAAKQPAAGSIQRPGEYDPRND